MFPCLLNVAGVGRAVGSAFGMVSFEWLVPLVTTVVGYFGYRLTRLSSRKQALDQLTELFASPEFRADKGGLYGWRFGRVPTEETEITWPVDRYLQADRIAIQYDNAGLILRNAYVKRDDFVDPRMAEILTAYRICWPVMHRRKEIEGSPNAFVHFEWLAVEAMKVLHRSQPPSGRRILRSILSIPRPIAYVVRSLRLIGRPWWVSGLFRAEVRWLNRNIEKTGLSRTSSRPNFDVCLVGSVPVDDRKPAGGGHGVRIDSPPRPIRFWT